MRWTAGKTRLQKRNERLDREEQWHKYFVWWPLRMSPDNHSLRYQPDIRVWLETVERRRIGPTTFLYRLPAEVDST
jgi:hypothetical protein